MPITYVKFLQKEKVRIICRGEWGGIIDLNTGEWLEIKGKRLPDDGDLSNPVTDLMLENLFEAYRKKGEKCQ